jgi:hypothetical protein
MKTSRAAKKESSLQEMLAVVNLSLCGQLQKVAQQQLQWIDISQGRLNFLRLSSQQLANSWSNF